MISVEDRDLVLRDLSARIPYGVKVRTNRGPEIIEGLAPFCHNKVKIALNFDWSLSIFDYTPYLRSLSTMTKEELHEVQEILGKGVEIHDAFISIVDSSINTFSYLELQAVFDWFNKHHFDYRGLIEKGLALEAPEGMYK